MGKKKTNIDELFEQERLLNIAQLMGGMIHNLSTPILGTSGQLSLSQIKLQKLQSILEKHHIPNEEYQYILDDIGKHINNLQYYNRYMSDIINTIKQHIKSSENMEKQLFNLQDIYDKSLLLTSFAAKENKITINFNLPDEFKLLNIVGEPTSLVQILVNLILNAIESYNKVPGKIDISVSKKIVDSKEYITISVQDFGPGIPEDVKFKLLTQMYTTKGKKGTGVGLYMSNMVLKKHFNGFLEIESIQNEGTIIHIFIQIREFF